MRQVVISKHGSPDVLVVRETSDPAPGPGQVRIRVAAAGVNFADILARLGLYPDAPKTPCVVGYEAAGIVDAVGPGVTALHPGDRVLAAPRFGGYTDTLVVAEGLAIGLPNEMTFETAAAIPVNYTTAWLMLVRLGAVQRGERVLVHAAAGGVGQAAIQLCRFLGAEVIGTASAGKHERLREQGVAHCIDYTREDFEAAVGRITEGRGVDVVLDAVGGDSFRKSYRCLAPLGRLFLFGISSFAPGKTRQLLAALGGFLRTPSFKPIRMMQQNRGVIGVNLGRLFQKADVLRTGLTQVLDLVKAGHLKPIVDRTFPFAEAGAAHAYIQDRKNFGKVLLVP